MKKILFSKFKHLTALLAVVLFSVFIVSQGAPVASAILIVGLWQLSQFAMSKRSLRCYIGVLTPDQVKEFSKICDELKEFADEVPALRALLREFPDVKNNLQKLRKGFGAGGAGSNGVRWIGNQPFVTDDCAKWFSSVLVVQCEKLGDEAMNHLCGKKGDHGSVLGEARGFLGISTKTSLSGTEVSLPTVFMSQVVELVFAYGQARQFATVFPLGAGTVKLPRLAAGEDNFGYLGVGTAGMSQTVPEKRAGVTDVTFTANKFGGIIRIPFELEVDTFVALGQFLARYIARQIARGEDRAMFLADGTATYANQTGVGKYCDTNATYRVKLDAGKTKVTDITLDNIRALRGRVSGAVLGNMAANRQTSAAYYMHPSLEPLLSSYNKYPNFMIWNAERMTLDGWPVRWVGVGAVNDDSAQADSYAMFFGDLSLWYLAERGEPRVEVSKEIYFATDEIAMRALVRHDVEAMAIDAMATLTLGAASA